jgi:hypothetical protein
MDALMILGFYGLIGVLFLFWIWDEKLEKEIMSVNPENAQFAKAFGIFVCIFLWPPFFIRKLLRFLGIIGRRPEFVLSFDRCPGCKARFKMDRHAIQRAERTGVVLAQCTGCGIYVDARGMAFEDPRDKST